MNPKGFLRQLQDMLATLATDHARRKLGPVIDETGLAHANPDWESSSSRQRIEIMITGDPSRVGFVADIIDKMQKLIFADKPEQKTELRVTGFLDGCIHRSKWTKKPFKAAQQARQWHCEQSKTRFGDALANSAGEMVDHLVLVGHRFDDDLDEVLRQAQDLKQQGVAVHCFHTGNDTASRHAYEKLAEETGGVFLQLPDQSSIAEVMPILMAHIHDKDALLALQPENESAQKLKSLLMRDAPDALPKKSR